jgi:cholesterol oxidase
MQEVSPDAVYDYVIVGSGFGGSVSAMRLAEKGYSVLVLERGKRFEDQDFAKTNWNIPKYLWLPALRCFGVLQISPFKDVLVLHGSGVGGGSLGYANVLMQPTDELFENPSWKHLADWKAILLPHYDTARRMLGAVQNPCVWPADRVVREIAAELRTQDTFRPTTVGVFFGEPGKEGQEVPDPYFDGEGPPRKGCIHCGACMVGCRNNAKNTLVKNYLYLAEKWGVQVRPECEVRDIRPLANGQPDQARYEVVYRSSTAWLFNPQRKVRARNVILSASALGTLRLLFRCRDITRSLPNISPRLGTMVRTNSEALLGATAKDWKVDYSKGIAITSIFQADPVTHVEPVRYPDGFSLMRMVAAPLVQAGNRRWRRIWLLLRASILHPIDLLRTKVAPGWARRTTIVLVMQTTDTRLRLRRGRSWLTFFRKGLVSEADQERPLTGELPIAHEVVHRFAARVAGIPQGHADKMRNRWGPAHPCLRDRTCSVLLISRIVKVFTKPSRGDGIKLLQGYVL